MRPGSRMGCCLSGCVGGNNHPAIEDRTVAFLDGFDVALWFPRFRTRKIVRPMHVGLRQESSFGFPIISIALATMGLVPCAVADAQPVPVGPELQVNVTTAGDQSRPSFTRGADGGFVAIWQSDDADSDGLFGRLIDAAGVPLGPEFAVNTTTYRSQASPDVGADAQHNFVVVWESNEQDGDSSGVVLRRFDSAGSALGDEVVVNNSTLGSQSNPEIGVSADGHVVVVWIDSSGLDGDGRGVFGRRFSPTGQPLGAEFQVNTTTAYNPGNPNVTAAADGSFVVVWTGARQNARDGDGQAIIARRFDADGTAIGGEFVVNSYTTGDQFDPIVTANADGGFIAAWEAANQDGDSGGVFARQFDSAGTPIGDEFAVNTYTTGNQFDGRPIFQDDGSYVIVWVSRHQDGEGSGVFGQHYSSPTEPIGSEFQVNTYTTSAQAGITIAPVGSFVVGWYSEGQDGDGRGIFAQRFETETVAVCGDPNGGGVTATDALVVLRAAVGAAGCELCVCDVDSSGAIVASDALIVLQAAVGGAVTLSCPACF